jgi:hypothetical protein
MCSFMLFSIVVSSEGILAYRARERFLSGVAAHVVFQRCRPSKLLVTCVAFKTRGQWLLGRHNFEVRLLNVSRQDVPALSGTGE